MKNVLIVDGYNAIYQVPDLRLKLSRGLEHARSALASLVSSWNRQHPSYECLIVFDGNDSARNSTSKTVIGGVPCFFTRSKAEADDEIIRNVREHRGPASNITVVSDDNYVRNNSKAHGAEVQPVSYLMGKSATAHSKSRNQASAPGEKSIPSKAISEINKELRLKYGI